MSRASGPLGAVSPIHGIQEVFDERACRECGCTDRRACPGGCWWEEWDLCSVCAGTSLPMTTVGTGTIHEFDPSTARTGCGKPIGGSLVHQSAVEALIDPQLRDSLCKASGCFTPNRINELRASLPASEQSTPSPAPIPQPRGGST